jgi:arylsulfatase A-like enzyme
MRKWILLFVPWCLLAQTPAKQPKLLLAIVIDQFRYDYLTRFRADYKDGLARLLEKGAVFTNANYEHIPTLTAIGHSTFLSGAPPAMSGIIGNEWWDRESGKRVTSVSDEEMQLLGATGRGASPRRLLQSTLGDQLKMSGKGGKVIGVSFKDRAAILPAGHMADAAYWFHEETGNWVSSTYYFAALPAWVADVNKSRPGDKYLNAEWTALYEPGRALRKMAAKPDKAFYTALEKTPFANEMIEEFAVRALDAEQLGRTTGRTDILAVSFSANDYLGHNVGPDAPEVREISTRTDRVLGQLFQAVETKVGLANTLIVLTADHGVAPAPEVNRTRKMPGGRLVPKEITAAIEKALVAKFGEGPWVRENIEMSIYLNPATIEKKGVDEEAVEKAAARAALALPHIFRVYTRHQMLAGAYGNDRVDVKARNGFNAKRSGNLVLIPDPYWMSISTSTTVATHGTPFSYDSHVPLIFLGDGIRSGNYLRAAGVQDVAVTLATLLAVEPPSGSVGRVLDEMLAAR